MTAGMKEELIRAAERAFSGPFYWASELVLPDDIFDKVFDAFFGPLEERRGLTLEKEREDFSTWFLLLCAEAL